MFGFLKNKLKEWAGKVSSEKSAENPKEKKTKKKIEKKKINSKEFKKEIQEIQEIGKELDKKLKEEVGSEEYIDAPISSIGITGIKTVDMQKLNSQLKVKKQGFFKRAFSSKIIFSQEDFENHKEGLEMLLLENNVAYEVTEKILERLEKELVGQEILKKDFETEILNVLRKIISEILVDGFDVFEQIRKKEGVYVILFCGVNGTGKTTTLAKIAYLLKNKGISSCIAAGDTFRAASIEQLGIHAKKVGVPIISSEYGKDAASVGFEAINYAKKNKIKVVLIDSAGRMHTAKNLMAEIEKIARVCKPDLKLFVGESITGNDIIEQVKSFNEAVGLDGIILSKADIDEKGGTAISVGYITGKPILFLGVGQNYKDLEVFDKEKFLDKLFG
jgi:fused signal recognition particle receptor